MKKAILIVAMAMTLTGCGGVWVHPTKTMEKQDRDKKECQYEAMKSAGSSGNAISDGLRRNEITRMCMEIRGYHIEYPQQ